VLLVHVAAGCDPIAMTLVLSIVQALHANRRVYVEKHCMREVGEKLVTPATDRTGQYPAIDVPCIEPDHLYSLVWWVFLDEWRVGFFPVVAVRIQMGNPEFIA
jgi:hypothetical protein